MMNTTMPPVPAKPDSCNLLFDRLGTADEAHTAQPVAFDLADQLTRWELQARIVADQPAAQIALEMGLSVSAVENFEAEHFNVRHRLQHSSIVLFQIVQIPTDELWAAADVGKFWAWLACIYGAVALDLVIPPFIALPVELRALGLRAYLHPRCEVCEEFRVVVAGKLIPISATNTVTGRRLTDKIQRASRRRVRPVDLLSSLSELICQPRNATPVCDEFPRVSQRLKESA